MNKILIIIAREYLSRVKKKSFLIMTILGPILLASVVIVPVYLAKVSNESKTIGVVDETGLFFETFTKSSTQNLTYIPIFENIITARDNFDNKNLHALLYVPQNAISAPSTIKLFAKKQISANLVAVINNILQKEIESHKLAVSGIDKAVLVDIQTPIHVDTIIFTDAGDEQYSFAEISTILGMIAGILIYIFIFSYGSQVMRGVIEEKTSRIIEIIVSSVKPFQLMMGKIIGIAMVGLTQFILWIVLSFIIITGFQLVQPDKFAYQEQPTTLIQNKGLTQDEIQEIQYSEMISGDRGNQILEGIKAINFPVIIIMFLFYFVFGYLLYASLFAAIGSAVDNEADTQQFMIPITVPLIIALVMSQIIVNEPEGAVAFWLSIIPFTSPIVMMVRLPFNPPIFDVIISMTLLLAGFIASTWFAAKIYRTGILMYGKKISYKELWKWLKYR